MKISKKLSLLVLLIFLSGFQANAASKPFFQLAAFDVPANSGNQKAQFCFLRQHLDEHLNFVVGQIIPRGVAEISELLQPQPMGNKTVRVAFATDYADLYHFHLRYSNQLPFTNLSAFMNSKDYHLHYHSFEHLDLMKIQWLQGLQTLNDPATQDWVARRLAKATAPRSSYGGSGLYQPVPAHPLPELSFSEMERLASLWNHRLGVHSPGAEILLLRVQTLNDVILGTSAVSKLLEWRSVASHDDRFEILAGLDLPNVWQPVDFFFAKTSDYPEVAAEIQAFSKRSGQAWVGNYADDRASLSPASEALRTDATVTFQKILRLIEANDDPLNTFKHVVLDSPNTTKAFVVNGPYIFAVHYNLSYGECPGTYVAL